MKPFNVLCANCKNTITAMSHVGFHRCQLCFAKLVITSEEDALGRYISKKAPIDEEELKIARKINRLLALE
jgi:hypothetical protein